MHALTDLLEIIMTKRPHRTSLKDLAKELGVSIATVSRALRSSPEIGRDMQQRVKIRPGKQPEPHACGRRERERASEPVRLLQDG